MFKFDCIIDFSSCHQVSLCLGVPFLHPQVLSQTLRRQDLIFSRQSFTFFPLKFAKIFGTHWLYSSLTSVLSSFHIRLFGMWLLADFNWVHSVKSPGKSPYWGPYASPHITLMFSVCFKLAYLVRI